MSIKITKTYLIFKKDLCVLSLRVLLFVGIAAHASWIVPIGHIHPQKNLFVNNIIIINKPIRKKGIIPSVKRKKIASSIPVLFEIPTLGECKNGSTFNIPSNPIKLMEKINSKST